MGRQIKLAEVQYMVEQFWAPGPKLTPKGAGAADGEQYPMSPPGPHEPEPEH